MIYIYTHAYNANKTLPRAIESILNQTNQDFIWYLCDNASTDDTRKTILSYAEKDKRIIPELRNINHLDPNYKGIQLFWLSTLASLCEKGNDDDFFCTLDADDEYKPGFFEKMLHFIKENALEVAACGHDFVDASTDSVIGLRTLDRNLILDSNRQFDTHFPEYHQFMRPIWGKLYSLSLLKQCSYENDFNDLEVAYGLDTLFCMRAFSRAKRAGIFSESLHKYYVSGVSVSKKYDGKRIISDQVLDKKTRDFLFEKTGRVSPRNNDFISVIYLNALKDTLAVLLNSKISIRERLCGLREILSCDETKQLAALESFGDWFDAGQDWRKQRREFFATVVNWLLSLQEVPDEQVESFCDMGEFACAAAEHADGWVSFNKLRIRLLIDQGRAKEGRAKLGELEEVLSGDVDLAAFRAQLSQ